MWLCSYSFRWRTSRTVTLSPPIALASSAKSPTGYDRREVPSPSVFMSPVAAPHRSSMPIRTSSRRASAICSVSLPMRVRGAPQS